MSYAPFEKLTALAYARAMVVLTTYLALWDRQAQNIDEFASEHWRCAGRVCKGGHRP